MSKSIQTNPCPEFPYFGATYPDARCINGYLWDLDKVTAEGGLYTTGDNPPCPFCNMEEYINDNWETYFSEDFDDDMATSEQIQDEEDRARELCREDILKFHKKYNYTPNEQIN